jgi:hypothetical protein
MSAEFAALDIPELFIIRIVGYCSNYVMTAACSLQTCYRHTKFPMHEYGSFIP